MTFEQRAIAVLCENVGEDFTFDNAEHGPLTGKNWSSLKTALHGYTQGKMHSKGCSVATQHIFYPKSSHHPFVEVRKDLTTAPHIFYLHVKHGGKSRYYATNSIYKGAKHAMKHVLDGIDYGRMHVKEPLKQRAEKGDTRELDEAPFIFHVKTIKGVGRTS